MSVGDIILSQLGGQRFVVMTGAKDFVWDDKKQTLRMSLPKNGSRANRLHITLRWDDTYNMRFSRYTPSKLRINNKKGTADFISEKVEEVKTYEMVYCDQLQELFTEVTKMYTHL